ncbi:MAG: VWA domain-containing protein [Nanoarchaeota archaeon]
MRLDFVNPEYLWFLLSIPLLVVSHFYFLHHARAKAMRFANFEALKRVTGKELITKNILVLILRCVILVLVILGAAGVEFWYVGASNQNDYVVAIDTSLSMTTTDLPPTRLEAAKEFAADFVNHLGGDSNVGLVSFSGITFVDEALNPDKAKIIRSIRNLDMNDVGGTDISGAIITGTNMLMNSKKGRVILLMSDGSHTASSEWPIRDALEYAKVNHVQVHTLAVGTDRGLVPYLPAGYNITEVFNRDILKVISDSTSGLFFDVADRSAWKSAQDTLFSQFDQGLLRKNLNYIFILLALMLLFIEWGLVNTRFRRIP